MIKHPTGIMFTSEEFRLRDQCLRCGRSFESLNNDLLCEQCSKENLQHCDMCEVLIRNGKYRFFTYDIRKDHRDGEEGFKASKEYVREFTYFENFNDGDGSGGTCDACKALIKTIKHVCGNCGNPFNNTEENYKVNGNTCGMCSARFDQIETSHE